MSITYLYSSNILDILPKVSQIIALQYDCISEESEYYGLCEDAIKKFPYVDFHTKEHKPGTIKLAGNQKGQRKILGMFFCYRRYYFSDPQISTDKTQLNKSNSDTLENRLMWLETCLTKVAKIKKLKSIVFPEYIGCDSDLLRPEWTKYEKLLLNFAKDNSHIKVLISSKRSEPIDNKNIKEIIEIENIVSTPTISYPVNLPWCNDNKLENIIKLFSPKLVETGWNNFFQYAGIKDIIVNLDKKLERDYNNKINIFPSPDKVFNALFLTPLSNIKVCIVGLDPYQTPGAAMGLAFSHTDAFGKIQPSLNNIYKEMESCGFKPNYDSGNLTKWSSQGVFLINTALTVQEDKSNSHTKHWKDFTKELLMYISNKCEHIVVILWGKAAQEQSVCFNQIKHKLLMSPHPSPYSASTGFFGSKPFIKANNHLKAWNIKEIDWNLI